MGVGAPSSHAQTAPTPPAPQEADPAIDMVGPAAQGVIGPLCSSLSGGFALAVVVASVAAGDQWDDVNPVYQDVLAAQVAACGIMPVQLTRTTCGPDATVGGALAAGAAPAGEVGAPVDPTTLLPRPRAVGGVVESVHVAEGTAAGAGVPPLGAGDQVAGALSCETEIVGGEFVPHPFDAPSSSSVPSEAGLGTDGPRPGHVAAPVAQDQGGRRSATGAALPPEASPASNTEAGRDGELAAAPATPDDPPGKGGKVALLAALALLTALSFIPSRPRTSAAR